MIETRYRGHKIVYKENKWVHENGGNIKEEISCAKCGMLPTQEGYDNCLGKLEGVKNACCGHGHEEDAYIQFENDSIIRGKKAIEYIKNIVD